jgi:hypothetical protein
VTLAPENRKIHGSDRLGSRKSKVRHAVKLYRKRRLVAGSWRCVVWQMPLGDASDSRHCVDRSAAYLDYFDYSFGRIFHEKMRAGSSSISVKPRL